MRTRRLAAATAAAVIGGAVLSGCGLISEITGGGLDIDFTQVQLHPTGDPGQWMDPGYAGGLGEVHSVPGAPCGASDGVLAVADGQSIVGYDMASAAEVWRVEAGTTCNGREVASGDLYLSRPTAEGSEYFQLDIATGEVQVFYTAPIQIFQTSVIGRGENAVYLHADADVGPALMAFAFDGTMLWQAPIDIMQQCHLLGEHIACESFEGTFTVLDATTGEPTIPETTIEPGKEVVWAVGGYTVVSAGITMDVETTPIFDFSGAEIGSVDDAALPGQLGLMFSVAYDVADLSVAGAEYVWLTDADGHSVVHWDQQLRLTASDVDLPENASLLAAASDGSTVLYDDSEGSGVLVAADGTVLHTFEAENVATVEILDGLIVDLQVVGSDMATTIYTPAG